MTPSEWYKATENEYINKRYVMFGLGNAEYVSEVLNNCRTEVKIIVFEPSASGVGQSDEDYAGLKELSQSGIEIYVEGKEQDTFTNFLYQHIDYSSLQGMIVFKHPSYVVSDEIINNAEPGVLPQLMTLKSSEKEFTKSIDAAADGIKASRLVKERFGEESFENMIINYSALSESKSFGSLIDNIDTDVPAIIVASGPSLSKNMNLLRDAQGKSFIISADSAVSALLANDIYPDIYISVDPHKEAKSFEDERTAHIPAVVELTSSKYAVKNNQTHFFLFNNGNSYLEKFIEKENVDMHLIGVGGSVANTCFDAAITMGFKTIIFIGLDLAYTGNKTHVENTARYGMKIDEASATFVADVYGQPVKSSSEFVLYKTLIEDEINANPQITVVDATEGGALINGTEIMSFKDAISTYCIKEFDAKRAIGNSEVLLNEEQKEHLRECLANMPKEIKELASYLRRNLKNYDDMYMMAKMHNLNKGRLTKILSDNDELSSMINDSTVLPYIEYLSQDAIHNVQENAYRHNEDVYGEIKEAALIGKGYDEGMLSGVEKALEIIGDRFEY